DSEGSASAARSIMTTDTFPKEVVIEMSNGSRIGGIAKGSGMIEPNMGTMLAFLYTDADLDAATLDQCLRVAVNKSFNMVVVDGDTSTNDMALITATGQSGRPDIKEFQQSLDHVCIRLAKMIAKDGEGASHLIVAKVTGAKNETDAVLAAKAIVRSPLVKTAIFGRDPNWGRVIAAVGYSGADVDQDMISLAFSNSDTSIKLVENGKINDISEDQLKYIMESEEIVINVNLGLGSGSAVAWGCDLTYDYVRINAEYTT
ncbi:MAG TPA: bifunctional ornithine acetyltransferase/N-acetylglutamate synthase, partial [archaeon]|nr:bifunctional ornithine acetyltransferase/N-acetylglutamate synthase [archaeon]